MKHVALHGFRCLGMTANASGRVYTRFHRCLVSHCLDAQQQQQQLATAMACRFLKTDQLRRSHGARASME